MGAGRGTESRRETSACPHRTRGAAGASLDAPAPFLDETYRSIPEALLFGMRLDAKLNHVQPAKPLTHSIEAYLAFLGAQRDIRIGREREALELLDQAIAFDPNFAAAIWSKGDLLLRRGEREAGEALKAKADEIDPDHAHISLLPNTANPIPALFAAAMEAKWTELEPGIAQREIEAKAYGIRVMAWSVDPGILRIEVVQADGAYGATAAALREKTGALLIVNGGYFDLDADDRLTPSGLLIIGGRLLRDVEPHAGSGVLVTRGGSVTIERSKGFAVPPSVDGGFQSGPLLVDPGGVLGIGSNDFNRVPRSAVCVAGDKIVFSVVEGGLSLYELAKLLIASPAQGGFGCERALNLDGGPSTQASLAAGHGAFEVAGKWNVLSALGVRRR
jgi:uncharacterized protein YigE (DUF2233 family)